MYVLERNSKCALNLGWYAKFRINTLLFFSVYALKIILCKYDKIT